MKEDFKKIAVDLFLFVMVILLSPVSKIEAQQIGPSVYSEQFRKYLTMSEADAKNNALTEYINALDVFDPNLYNKNKNVFNQILEKGWSGNEPIVMQAFSQSSRSISLVLAGNKKPMIKYPPWSKVAKDPLHCPILGDGIRCEGLYKTILLQALWAQSQKNPDMAISIYKDVLIFANRLTGENTPDIPKLISLAMQTLTFNQIQKFLERIVLTEKQYNELGTFLFNYKVNEYPMWKYSESEYEAFHWVIQNPEEGLKAFGFPPADLKQASDLFRQNQADYLRQYAEFQKSFIEILKLSYPQFRKVDLATFCNRLPKPLRMFVPNFLEFITRENVAVAKSRLAVFDVALRKYKMQKGSYPPTLDVLGITGDVAKDPFTEQSFLYNVSGGKPILYSAGPNMINDGGIKEYDSKAGTVSAGDIVIRFK